MGAEYAGAHGVACCVDVVCVACCADIAATLRTTSETGFRAWCSMRSCSGENMADVFCRDIFAWTGVGGTTEGRICVIWFLVSGAGIFALNV